MAKGDIIIFNQFLEDVGQGLHDLNADTFKYGLVTASVTPTVSSSDPRWGSGGSTNFATNQVTPGGNYASGGPAIDNNTYTQTSGTATWDADPVEINGDASNPNNARWAIVYNDTDAGKRAVCAVDLGGAVDLSAGDFANNWNAAGILTLARAA